MLSELVQERETSSSHLLPSSSAHFSHLWQFPSWATNCLYSVRDKSSEEILKRTAAQIQRSCSVPFFYFFSRFFSLRNEFHIFGIYYLVTVSPDSLIRHSTSTRDCYNLGVWNLIKLCHSPRVHHNTPVGLVRQSKLSKWQIPPQKMQQLPPHIVCRRTWCSYTLSSFLLCTTQGQSRGKTIGLVQNAFPLSFRSH